MYEFVKKHGQQYPVGVLCDVVGVSRSAYYAYVAGQTYRPTVQKEQCQRQVQEVFAEHKRRYGSRRLVHALRAKGQRVGRDFVRKLMKDNGLLAIQRQRPTVPELCTTNH